MNIFTRDEEEDEMEEKEEGRKMRHKSKKETVSKRQKNLNKTLTNFLGP